jgi:hypothetical protein
MPETSKQALNEEDAIDIPTLGHGLGGHRRPDGRIIEAWGLEDTPRRQGQLGL